MFCYLILYLLNIFYLNWWVIRLQLLTILLLK